MTPFCVKALKFTLFFRLDATKFEFKVSSISFRYFVSFACCFFFFLREYLKRIVEVIFCQNMSKLSLIHSTQKAGPNTEIYGPRSEYGFLRTARRPIRMQDSSKPYNNIDYVVP